MRKYNQFLKASIFLFVMTFSWVGIGANNIDASENDYKFKEVTGGVEITGYYGDVKDITIPSSLNGKSVISIGKGAFFYKGLTSVVLPDTVINIGEYSFERNQLTSVTIGKDVTNIGRAPFLLNPLEEITVDIDNQNYQDIGKKGLYTKDGSRLVQGTTSGVIEEDTKTIGEKAFTGVGVDKITIPESVTTIENSAFSRNQLSELVIPSNVISVGSFAFQFNKLTSVDIQANLTKIESFTFNENLLMNITIPEGVKEIESAAFQNNRLVDVELPNSIELFENSVFAENQLTNITIGPNLTSIGTSFLSQNPLSQIKVSEDNQSFKDINEKGLYSKDGKNLIQGTLSGEIEDGTKEIGTGALKSMGLKTITIPPSVITINNSAFFNNDLTSVVIPDQVEDIGSSAFKDNQLTNVKLGKNVKKIWGEAFAQNPLANIEVDANNQNFSDVNGEGVYTKDLKTLVQGTSKGLIELETENIGMYSFSGMGLESISISENVTTIEYGAFWSNNLTSALIPANVTTIEKDVFNNNLNLIVFGEVESKAEAYAHENNIRFLEIGNPWEIKFKPNGSTDQWLEKATTVMTVDGIEPIELAYKWSEENSIPSSSAELDGQWHSYTNGEEISSVSDGEWYVHLYMKDALGNEKFARSDLFKVDNHPPKVSIHPNGNETAMDDITTTVTITDETSGVDTSSLQYMWSSKEAYDTENEDSWIEFESGDEINKSDGVGTWYLIIRAKDIAGNKVEVISEPFQLRKKGSGGGYIPSDDTSLKTIRLDLGLEGLLELDPNQHEYVLETEEAEVLFSVEANDPETKITVNDMALEKERKFSLKEGENNFELIVTAENGNDQTYTITINRLNEVTFIDIKDHWAEEFIKESFRNGWFKGYPDDTFRSEDNLGRMQIASLFVRILELEESIPVSFTDAQGLETETLKELEKAYAYGIIQGYGDDTFKPYNDVSRAHIALMIARVYEQITGSAYIPSGQAVFPDITHYDEETQNAIALLKELRIADGDHGKFKPGNMTTRAHAAKMLVDFKIVLDNL